MPTDRQDLRNVIHAVAYAQAGYFTAAQARDAGYSYQAQKHHVDRGNWLRVDRGIFRLPGWPVGRDDGYVLWHLWAQGRAVVSHDTALALHELSDVDPPLVHLSVPPGFRALDQRVVLHRQVLPETDVQEGSGFRLTTPVRTLLDAAASDLSQEHVDRAVADAVQRGLATGRRLRDRADAMGDRAALRIERALAISTGEG